jgi:hypothetical protein
MDGKQSDTGSFNFQFEMSRPVERDTRSALASAALCFHQ